MSNDIQDPATIRRNVKIRLRNQFLVEQRMRLLRSARVNRRHSFAEKAKKIQVFNLGKKDFGPAIFVVIGAKKGKLLHLGQVSKSLDPEFGGGEERAASS